MMASDEPIDETTSLRRIAVGSAAATLLLLAALMGSPLGKSAAMPGPLSANHAHLRQQCNRCHVDASDAFQNLMHGVGVTDMDREQSALCLECHAWGANALDPHGWSPAERSNHSDSPGTSLLFNVPGVPLDREGKLGCSTCHSEHRGRDSKLAKLSDSRCQACHENRFGSFQDGHPAFGKYPQTRRTHIVFDHAEHILEHFREAGQTEAPQSCTTCHELEAAGERMPVRDYASACGACHTDDIRGASQLDSPGLVVFGLPALDTYSLEERRIGIGQWPADSELTEAPISPFVQLLLMSDANLSADLTLIAQLDLLDLSAAELPALQAVQRVAWGIKQLFSEMASGGHIAIESRLKAAMGYRPERISTDELLAGLPEDLVTQAIHSWFPELDHELLLRAAGNTPKTMANEPLVDADIDIDRAHEAWVNSGGWYLQGLDFALRYRPIGHADPFLRAWLELSAAGGEDSRQLLDQLGRPEAEGTCIKCHSIDATESTPVIRWSDGLQRTDAHKLTRFSHASHFAMATDNACAQCHRLNTSNEDWDATYAGLDPSLFVPGFLPMQAQECASCHDKGGAPSDCLTCHRYHPLQERLASPESLLSALPILGRNQQAASSSD